MRNFLFLRQKIHSVKSGENGRDFFFCSCQWKEHNHKNLIFHSVPSQSRVIPVLLDHWRAPQTSGPRTGSKQRSLRPYHMWPAFGRAHSTALTPPQETNRKILLIKSVLLWNKHLQKITPTNSVQIVFKFCSCQKKEQWPLCDQTPLDISVNK